MMKDIITIDGPSGSGKSTVSKLLARKLEYRYLDTGALYRAVAWKVHKENIDPEDETTLCSILEKTNIRFKGDRIMVNGTDITSQIRTPEIGELSSRVSAMPVVRKHLLALQRQIGLEGKTVIEGRDIGTIIFPEAKNKFFLDASIKERANRRYKELKNNCDGITLNTTAESIKKRDSRDSKREHAPLKRTKDMIYIDTSNLTVEKVVQQIIDLLKKP